MYHMNNTKYSLGPWRLLSEVADTPSPKLVSEPLPPLAQGLMHLVERVRLAGTNSTTTVVVPRHRAKTYTTQTSPGRTTTLFSHAAPLIPLVFSEASVLVSLAWSIILYLYLQNVLVQSPETPSSHPCAQRSSGFNRSQHCFKFGAGGLSNLQ